MTAPLELLGLDDREFAVYRSLLRSKNPSIRRISAETGINRGTTHELLQELVEKGLATYQLKGKRKHYLAENPCKLLDLTEQKIDKLKQLGSSLQTKIIPELNDQQSVRENPTTRYYEGEKGIEIVLRDLLSTMEESKQSEYYVYSAQPIRKYLYKFFPNFTKQRIQKELFVKVIALGSGGKEAKLSERKWLSENKGVKSSSYILIYADKFAIISVTQNQLPYGAVIHESGIAATQKLIFKSLWNLL